METSIVVRTANLQCFPVETPFKLDTCSRAELLRTLKTPHTTYRVGRLLHFLVTRYRMRNETRMRPHSDELVISLNTVYTSSKHHYHEAT